MDTLSEFVEQSAAPALVQIAPEHLQQVLPMVFQKLVEVATRSRGNLSAHGMINQFASGNWQLWIIWDGTVKAVMGTEVYTNVAGNKVCAVRFLTGEDSGQWLGLLDDLENWARFNDCVKLDLVARKGWARKLQDYKLTHVLLEKDI